MTVCGALILAKREAKFEIRCLAFRVIFSGEISSVFEDYDAWRATRLAVNSAFNACMTRPLINVGYPDRWILDSSHIHRWLSCVFLALDSHLL